MRTITINNTNNTDRNDNIIHIDERNNESLNATSDCSWLRKFLESILKGEVAKNSSLLEGFVASPFFLLFFNMAP